VGKILVLGIGNILLSDEGIGVRIIEELQKRFTFPPNVELIDGGTAGLQLLPLIEEADHLIVVDAIEVGAALGTVFRAERQEGSAGMPERISLHEVGLLEVLSLAELHSRCPPAVVIGIQPKDLSPSLSLSPELEASIPRVIEVVIAELDGLGARPSASAEQ
jgi:hydrogenase maturation protease